MMLYANQTESSKLKGNESEKNTALEEVLINCQRFEENYMGHGSTNSLSDLL